MQLPLDLPLKPSRRLAALLLAAHGGAAFALAALIAQGHAFWLPLLLLPGIITSLAWQLLRLFGARRVVRLTLHKDGTVEYLRHDGISGTGRVDPQSSVLPWLVVLLLRSAIQPHVALTLLPDALEPEDFRRLRLWLRWLAVQDGK